MKIRLKDIIDLAYLISQDDALTSREDIKNRTIKDRRIFSQCRENGRTPRALLLSWLVFRKEEFFKDKKKKRLPLLPGTVFSVLYNRMVYAAVFFGGISGVTFVLSFLAYHGTRPINVAVFIALFVVFQVALMCIVLILLVKRCIGMKTQRKTTGTSVFQTLAAAFFFSVLPKLLKKLDRFKFRKNLDALVYTSTLIRTKSRGYKDLFFWPFFILTSVFAFSFSAGALCGTFFRVVVSDMAFGWQSTLMATSDKVYALVSFIAMPWSWFMPENLAHPSLEQIEGSRIILKDGISVLATQDLISWWPFICLSILFYAVIPRGMLILAGTAAQTRALRRFDFSRAGFRQVIIRMQSPTLEITSHDDMETRGQALQTPDDPGMDQDVNTRIPPRPVVDASDSERPYEKAWLLASKQVYTDAVLEKITRYIAADLYLDIEDVSDINFEFARDTKAVRQIQDTEAGHVVLLHEVWQPPIRGLLYYIQQLKTAMPAGRLLWILLTRDPGQKDLYVDENDMNFQVWKRAVITLKQPDIIVKRMMPL